MARPGRLELPTLCLEGRRSLQLSYGRVAHHDFTAFVRRTETVSDAFTFCPKGRHSFRSSCESTVVDRPEFARHGESESLHHSQWLKIGLRGIQELQAARADEISAFIVRANHAIRRSLELCVFVLCLIEDRKSESASLGAAQRGSPINSNDLRIQARAPDTESQTGTLCVLLPV